MKLKSLLMVLQVALMAVSLLGIGAPASSHAGSTISPMAQVSPMTTSGTSGNLTPNGIMTSVFGLGMGFLQSILNGVEQLINTIFGGFGQAVSEVFSSWGYSFVQAYGVWAPAGLVIGIGAAAFIGYLVISGIDMEKDVIGAEEDI